MDDLDYLPIVFEGLPMNGHGFSVLFSDSDVLLSDDSWLLGRKMCLEVSFRDSLLLYNIRIKHDCEQSHLAYRTIGLPRVDGSHHWLCHWSHHRLASSHSKSFQTLLPVYQIWYILTYVSLLLDSFDWWCLRLTCAQSVRRQMRMMQVRPHDWESPIFWYSQESNVYIFSAERIDVFRTTQSTTRQQRPSNQNTSHHSWLQ